MFSRLTDFVIRGMLRRNISGIFGYLDDYLVVAETQEECNDKLHAYWVLAFPGLCYCLG